MEDFDLSRTVIRNVMMLHDFSFYSKATAKLQQCSGRVSINKLEGKGTMYTILQLKTTELKN